MLSILSAIIIAATITITTGLIIYLVVAAIVGLVAEFIVGWRLPFGFIGAIIAALVGIWCSRMLYGSTLMVILLCMAFQLLRLFSVRSYWWLSGIF